MKWFIVGSALFLICISFMVFQNEHDRHYLESRHVKYAAQDAAAAAAQYYDKAEYAEGRYVFNQAQGRLAAEYIIKQDLELDNNFMPKEGSYWRDKVTYSIEFYDDQTIYTVGPQTGYPFLYTHPTTDFTIAIGYPTVIVTIYAGKARYSFLSYSAQPAVYRTGAHEWKSY